MISCIGLIFFTSLNIKAQIYDTSDIKAYIQVYTSLQHWSAHVDLSVQLFFDTHPQYDAVRYGQIIQSQCTNKKIQLSKKDSLMLNQLALLEEQLDTKKRLALDSLRNAYGLSEEMYLTIHANKNSDESLKKILLQYINKVDK